MDEGVSVLNDNHGFAANLLCPEHTIEEALQLYDHDGNRYHPLLLQKCAGEGLVLDNSVLLFKGYDPEYRVIPRFFRGDGDAPIFNGSESAGGVSLPCHHLLNLPSTPEYVQFRQDAVRELVENPQMYTAFEKMLASSHLYGFSSFTRALSENIRIKCNIGPKELSDFVDNVAELEQLHPESGPIKEAINWAKQVGKDSYFQELVRKKRKITDSRIIAIYTERFGDLRYGLLKPGVNPEEVFDFLEPSASSHTIEKRSRRGKKIRQVRAVVKYQDPGDQTHVERIVGHARQRMDVLNEISAQMLAVPTFLMQLQMKHLYQGAYMHMKLKEAGFPVSFPEISSEQGVLEVEDLYPIRMVFEQIAASSPDPRKLTTNSLNFSSDDRIIQIEGPNKRGKSECWRSMHLLNALTNAGYPIPASSATVGPSPNCHFISCKGSSGHGGSEIERSLRQVGSKLEEVALNDDVILDELGDSTNAPTALEFARRLLPLLQQNGNRVFITSHHDALTNYISENLGGRSFMPNPSGKKTDRFKVVPSNRNVDFRPEETLDDLGITQESLAQKLPNEARLAGRRREPEIPDYPDEFEDDIPF